MAELTRRTALALAVGAAVTPPPGAAVAEAAAPTSPVAAVLARHPWIVQPKNIESTALAGKLAEYLGWPGSAGRAVVRAAYEQMVADPQDDAAFFADLDRRIADVLSLGGPLPVDRAHGLAAETKFAEIVAEIEERLTRAAPITAKEAQRCE